MEKTNKKKKHPTHNPSGFDLSIYGVLTKLVHLVTRQPMTNTTFESFLVSDWKKSKKMLLDSLFLLRIS